MYIFLQFAYLKCVLLWRGPGLINYTARLHLSYKIRLGERVRPHSGAVGSTLVTGNNPLTAETLSTVCRWRILEERRRNLTCFSPAKAKESTVLMGLSLMTSMEMYSEPAKA